MDYVFDILSKKSLPNPRLQRWSVFLSRSFIILNLGPWPLLIFTLWMKERASILACRLSWLECSPVHQEAADSIPSQGTYLGLGFDPSFGCVQKATDPFFSHIHVFPSVSSSFSKINKKKYPRERFSQKEWGGRVLWKATSLGDLNINS